MRQELQPNQQAWHHLPLNELVQVLDCNARTGLTDSEAELRLARDGKNALPPPKKLHPILRFLLQFHSPLIYMLIIVMIFCFANVEIVEGVVIFIVVILNAIIGFVQEYKSEKDSEALNKMLSLSATVIRGGLTKTVDATTVVVGDIVSLQGGDKIPADCRLFEVKNFQTQEAALTGETTANPKTIEDLPEETVLGERTNMCFSGTHSTQGTAKGIVVATGIHTEIGKINAMVQGVDEKATPLTQQMNTFGNVCVVLVIVLMIVAFLAQYLMNRDVVTWVEALLHAASIGVAAIPEGLPAIVSLTLAIGMQRMAKRNALIRSMPAVETLGAVSVICSDKTGTLTTNQMTVRAMLTSQRKYRVTGSGYSPDDGEVTTLQPGEALTLDDPTEHIHPGLGPASSSSSSLSSPHTSPLRRSSTSRHRTPSASDRERFQKAKARRAMRLKDGKPPMPLLRRSMGKQYTPEQLQRRAEKRSAALTPRTLSHLPLNSPASLFHTAVNQSTGASSAPGQVASVLSPSQKYHSQLAGSGSGDMQGATRPGGLPSNTPIRSPGTTYLSDKPHPEAGARPQSKLSLSLTPQMPAYSLAGNTTVADSEYFFDHPRLLRALSRCGILCNDSSLSRVSEKTLGKQDEIRWEIQGDTTEGALYPLAIKCGVDVADIVVHCPRVDVLPFDSQFGFMAAVHRCPVDPSDVIYPPAASPATPATVDISASPATPVVSSPLTATAAPTTPGGGSPAPSSSSSSSAPVAAAPVSPEQALFYFEVPPSETNPQSLVFRGQDICFLKGAPEKVLSLCRDQVGVDESGRVVAEPLNRDYWLREQEAIAAVGLRTLALAQKTMPASRFENPAAAQVKADDPYDLPSSSSSSSSTPQQFSKPISVDEVREGGFTLLGVVGIFDPPRAESKRAIAQCHRASIKVVMITGDHAKTAAAIGGLLGLDPSKIHTSTELATMSDDELLETVEETEIYARATPADKLRIVQALQKKGYITAMTGDGVNDAPALKQAHAGVAMGINGTEVAKEASKMVLTDDNFATIVAAVEEGRKVFNALKRSIMYILPTGMGESLTLLISSFIGAISPITPLQILYVNTITSVTLSSLIPFQKGEHNVLDNPPRNTKKPLLTSTIFLRTMLVGIVVAASIILYFFSYVKGDDRHVVVSNMTEEIRRHSAVSVNMIIFAEIFFLFNTVYLKKPSTTWRVFPDIGLPTLLAILILIICQFILTYVPGLNELFSMAPMRWYEWGWPLALGTLVFLVVELEKWIRRCRRRRSCLARHKSSDSSDTLTPGAVVLNPLARSSHSGEEMSESEESEHSSTDDMDDDDDDSDEGDDSSSDAK